jgi:hypothetical protein
MLQRQRGALRLELENGTALDISDRHLTFKLQGPTEQRISVYRLRILERVPEHLSAGYVAPEEQSVPAEQPSLPEMASGDEARIEGR